MSKVSLRIKAIYFATPIVDAAGLATATWVKQPVTLRGDAVEIIEGEPTVTEDFSNENDPAEDISFVGATVTAAGSFIKMTKAEYASLIGGEVVGDAPDEKFHKDAVKPTINKAIKFETKEGGDIIIPNAKGYVLFNAGVGEGGKAKAPFKFWALPAAADWSKDIIW